MKNKIAKISFALILGASLTQAEWKKEAIGSANLSQTTLTNWEAGGEDVITWNIKIEGKIEQDQLKYNWTNSFKSGYGQNKIGDKGFRKSLDELFIESLYRYKLNSLLNPYASATLQTQYTKSYDYADSSEVVSDFWDPGYLTQSAGMGLNPLPNLITRLGFALKETFSSDYGWADERGVQNPETFRIEPGLESITTYSQSLSTILKYNTRLAFFVNFKGMDAIDSKWENTLVAQVSKYVAVNFGYTVLYDKDQGDDVQQKRDLSVGLTYSFF